MIMLFLLISVFEYSLTGDKAEAANRQKSKQTVPIIFDSDIGPDYDDIGAITILHAMADNNECKILATIASNKHKRIAPVLDVMNTYFNRPDIPIGVVRGNAVDMEAPQKWDSLIVAKYPQYEIK